MQIPPEDHFQLRRCGIVLLVAAGLVPAALMFYHVLTNWTPLPLWDEWFTPGNQLTSWCNGTLTLKELFVQHNESRKFFPRLLYLGLAKIHGWDVRDAMVVTFASFCGLNAMLYRLLRLTPGASGISTLVAWAAMSFLCFSPVQFDNFLWGLQFEPLFPVLALLLAVGINLSGLSFGLKVFANLMLALVATYTFANGMLLWLLAIPLPSPAQPVPIRHKVFCYATYGLAAVAAIGAYFIGYQKPSNHPPLMLGVSHLLDLSHYFILWEGAYFHSALVGAFVVGCVAAFICTLVLAGVSIVAWRGREWRWCYPWLLLLTYAVITGMITAVGRLGLGLNQALDSRYTVFSLSFHLAIIGLAFALYGRSVQNRWTKMRRVILGGAVVVFALVAPAWCACYRDGRAHLTLLYERNCRLLLALEWVDVIPDNPDLALIFPYVDWLTGNTHVLARAGVLRLPFVHGSLAAAVKQTPAATDSAHGYISSVTIQRDHTCNLAVNGRAWLPEKRRRPDCVVLGYENPAGNFKLLTVVEALVKRNDAGKHFHKRPVSRAAFWASIDTKRLGLGKVRIGAWAVDTEAKCAWPINALPGVTAVDWRSMLRPK